MLPAETLAAAALVLSGSYLVFGLTGFGSTVLALPLLVYLMPLKLAVPLLLLLDFTASLLIVGRVRRGVRIDELGRLVPFLLAGLVLGATLLVRLPERPLLGVLGVFLVLYASYGLARRAGVPGMSRAWGPPFGLVSGAFSAMFGTGGVLLAVYISARIRDKTEFRATSATAIFFNACVRLALFGAMGLLGQPELWTAWLVLLPCAMLGIFLGSRLHARVPAGGVVRTVYLVLVVAGVSLLVRVAG